MTERYTERCLAQEIKWWWAGHIVKLDRNSLTEAATLQDPRRGSRGPNIPATIWMDDMKKQGENYGAEKRGTGTTVKNNINPKSGSRSGSVGIKSEGS